MFPKIIKQIIAASPGTKAVYFEDDGSVTMEPIAVWAIFIDPEDPEYDTIEPMTYGVDTGMDRARTCSNFIGVSINEDDHPAWAIHAKERAKAKQLAR